MNFQQIIQTFITNAIGHKATTIIGLVLGAIGYFVTASSAPAVAGLLPPTLVTDLGYVLSTGAVLFGAAVKNPGTPS